MRILALQLKRIGDLVLTTPALRMLRAAWPEAHLALGVNAGCAPLLGAIAPINAALVFGPGRGFAPWQQVLTGPWDLCLDFTGNDRSALATALSRAKQRTTFAWLRRNRIRALGYRRFVDSSVRERHTVDHYCDLSAAVIPSGASPEPTAPELRLPVEAQDQATALLAAHGIDEHAFALLHPGTARPEKFWLAERWAQVAAELRERHGLAAVLTGGSEAIELAHAAGIATAAPAGSANLAGKMDLLTLAALAERARIVISCDTAMVHLAAAFRTPQIALFGPTNPFHWRPRHDRALVLSAAQPDAPLTDFQPRMKGAPMERISTAVVIRATESLLLSK
ncbi:MAG: heptosyltransferase [Chthoniobacter sp.]|nr:heptosyltransferase [Chthoniobacter sp.]